MEQSSPQGRVMRKNKSYQDQQTMEKRDRVHEAQRLVEWCKRTKPTRTADWTSYRSSQ